jgi:hypothetical protein
VAESVLYQALVKIRDYLRDVVGDGGTNYWYTPRAVEIVTDWNDPLLWDEAGGTVYGVRVGDAIHREETTGENRCEADVYVLVTTREEEPGNTVRNVQRMLRDVRRCLLQSDRVTLGGLVLNAITGSDGLIESQAYFEERSWIGAEMTFRLSFNYPAAAP